MRPMTRRPRRPSMAEWRALRALDQFADRADPEAPGAADVYHALEDQLSARGLIDDDPAGDPAEDEGEDL